MTFELLEDRRLLALDYGDAPDTLSGTGPGNYNTLSTDNGPNHTIVVGLKLGANVDGDGGALQNAAANADDVNGALPDDEDGLLNPGADLVLTIGAQPTLNLRVTNTSGVAATLYGWIDYNGNGVFDNATERASVAVPNGTNNLIKTLTLPAIPTGLTGTTYARFRLSTDAAAANSTGAASDGEVEDYRVSITAPSSGLADGAKTKKIASGSNNGPTLTNSDYFGRSVAALGDIDGDGITDLAVGAIGDDTGGSARGAVHVLLMNADGTVKTRQKLAGSNSPHNASGDYFGSSLASLGDLDGDGITDLVIGAERNEYGGGSNRGALNVVFLNANGTVKDYRDNVHDFPFLAQGDYFGRSLASLGDLDGDGVTDLAVGAYGDDTGGTDRGAVYILFMNSDGDVKSSQKIASGTGSGPTLVNSDKFGSSVTSLGDLDGDGVRDLAVGAIYDDSGGTNRGAVHALFMNANGTVKSSQKIASGIGGGPTLLNGDQFGASLAVVGDLDGDGVTDLAVGANYDDTGGTSRGAVHVLFMNANGTVKASHKIANGTNGGPTLANDDRFGVSISSLGDLDGDGIVDLAVGANFDDTGGTNRGAVHMLFLDAAPNNVDPVITSPAMASVPENSTAVMTVTATDANLPPQTITFSIVGGADQAKFSITTGGALSFITAPDFEAPTDANGDNVYVVTVEADDGNGGTDTETITVTVTAVNDNPPIFQPDIIALNLAENTKEVIAVAATDADRPTTALSYSIVDLADDAQFSLSPEGVLSFNTAPDYEQPGDADGDNVYVVAIEASDGTATAILGVLVTVTPVNDNSPVFTSLDLVSVEEFQADVLTVTASDADLPAQPVTLSIVGGADQSKFAIAPNGELSFISPPAFDPPGDANGDNIYVVRIEANDSNGRSTTQTLQVSVRQPADFGDAPDGAPGTGPGNYNTSGTDNGPSHSIIAGLRLGAAVDGDSGSLQNVSASADDVNGALPDDEDGLTNPMADLVLTVGAQPTVSVRVTNTTGVAATLYGWIDYNGNGVFENSERASNAVPSGTAGGIVTLAFQVVAGATFSTTYARFRLSTDTAAANPTGHAADGEVEDYRVTIRRPSDGTAASTKTRKLASSVNGMPALANGDMFGSSLAALGDLDGDGVEDFAVGSPVEFGRGSSGEVHVLFMNPNGTVKNSQKITSGVGGGPSLSAGDYFGHGMSAIGDLDGDGVTDLVVGATKDDTGGYIAGAAYVLLMNPDGTVKSSQKIASGISGGPTLASDDRFGLSMASLGDLDGDGVIDLAIGSIGDDAGGSARGAVYVLFMNPNGMVKSSQKIANETGGGPLLADLDLFGSSLASLGDIDGDGITDIAVGALRDDAGGYDRGAVYVLLMNSNGTVKSSHKIASGVSGGPELQMGDRFGRSLTALGDLDGDGVNDLAVGAYGDDSGGSGRGAVHVLLLNTDGTVKQSSKIANGLGGGPTLANYDAFGSSLASLGDVDGDGVTELAVGAERDDTGGNSRGAAYVLFLNRANTNPIFTSPAMANVPENTTAVMTVTAIDTDVPPQAVTFSIVGGADESKFTITTDGVLSFILAPDYEAPADVDADNDYEVTVQASDGSGGTATQTIRATVTPVNDNGPVFTSSDAVSVPENSTTILNVTATDADLPPQALTYSIAGGADAARFSLTDAGALSFAAAPDFELPSDANGDNIYVVIVRASDGALSNLQAILVSVTPVNDNTPVITSSATASINENTTAVINVTAIDADLPVQAISFSIVGGADQARFTIGPNGALSFIAPPNFEAPADADANNVYVVAVEASDGSLTNVQSIQVIVIDVNENPVGDYNRNGAVDAADYVLWRKFLGTMVPPFSGADGDGNGTVEENDYGVWRTNFGGTLSSGSAAVAGGVAANDVHAPSESQANAEPFFAAPLSDGVGVARARKLFSATSISVAAEAVGGPNRLTHPEGGDSPIVARLRDNAIVSWLRDRADARPNQTVADFDDDSREQNDDWAPTNQLFDGLDQVFASLGASSGV